MNPMTASTREQIGVQPFVITRRFDASRDRVWQAWTERRRLMQWFGPNGFTMPAAKMDFRPGGMFHYCLCAPDGGEMWGRLVYREIVAPERIVMVNAFSDEDGGLTRHPFAPSWPLEMLAEITLLDAGGKTRVTLKWSPLRATDEEQRTFAAGHAGMQQGWNGTLEQLERYLAEA